MTFCRYCLNYSVFRVITYRVTTQKKEESISAAAEACIKQWRRCLHRCLPAGVAHVVQQKLDWFSRWNCKKLRTQKYEVTDSVPHSNLVTDSAISRSAPRLFRSRSSWTVSEFDGKSCAAVGMPAVCECQGWRGFQLELCRCTYACLVLDAFAEEMRKATVSPGMSVRPSVRMEQLDFY